jgi:hypothetical protein
MYSRNNLLLPFAAAATATVVVAVAVVVALKIYFRIIYMNFHLTLESFDFMCRQTGWICC